LGWGGGGLGRPFWHKEYGKDVSMISKGQNSYGENATKVLKEKGDIKGINDDLGGARKRGRNTFWEGWQRAIPPSN